MPKPATAASWIAALGATLLMQSVASFLTQTLPVVAPLIMASAGLAPERIGNLSSLVAFGTVLFLLLGGPFLARLGPVRTLQLGTGIAAAALLVAAMGALPALMLASLMLGIGYGPTPPAGSRILAATAPKDHRTLIFSVKQAGAPLGGALAGLIAAPVAAYAGWGAALLVAVATAVVAAAAIQPLRESLDVERDPARRIGLRDVLSPHTIAAPVAALRIDPLLPRLTALSVAFAVCQGCLFSFTVTWLVETRGMSLVEAGGTFAAMQVAGVVARILLGWLADRTGRATRNLVVQAFVAAGSVVALALLPAGAPGWVLGALCALAGFVGASWNGISLAEVARVAPPDRVSDVTSGTTLFVFLGYVAGPSAFSALVTLSGSWSLPMVLVALLLAVVAALVGVSLRR
ncbi:MFS transporter [Roseomonas sp. JC162]|uniref:MFS transporter n=1 Tax=Neoroseomonas marina TaxID=1232220 RepID=A0A848E862_9PROT|nr:MFS transporter [Neoroseomonas marina]NMJ39673.1 MFS transporter [Neoroseomonas marina]